MWGNGFSGKASFRDGILEKMNPATRCYFATVIRVWGKLILCNTRFGRRNSESLTACNFSSLVIDYFCESEQDMTVTGLYCDYLDRKEQTTLNMLGVMLKQLVGGGNIPEDIRNAFEKAKGHFGGVRLKVGQLVDMLKAAIAQRKRVVICIDGLDESLVAHRNELLHSLQSIVQVSPNVRLFITGRPFITGEIEKHFPRAETISVSPTREDTETFLKMKLDGDPEPDAMDEGLRSDIMKIIPKTISEMYVPMPNFPAWSEVALLTSDYV